MEQGIILLVLLVMGGAGLRKGFQQIQTGSGWLCSRMEPGTLQYLNSKPGLVPKVLLALVLAYIAFAGMVIKGIFRLVLVLTDRH